MSYAVKEIYYTLQCEGCHAGRPAVFCRFTACNLWSGREIDRSKAICRFCDTDFVGTDGPGGGVFHDSIDLVKAIIQCWLSNVSDINCRPTVVCTGGEPLLQLNAALVNELHRLGFYIALETNGTRLPPKGIDWICVSPKAGSDLVLREADEVKLVYPQAGLSPETLACMGYRNFFLQPMDGPDVRENTEAALAYCLGHPRWRLSIQLHKILELR